MSAFCEIRYHVDSRYTDETGGEGDEEITDFHSSDLLYYRAGFVRWTG